MFRRSYWQNCQQEGHRDSVGDQNGHVVRLFAEAHKLDGQLKGFGDGHHDATPGGAIEFCEDDAGAASSLRESPCLRKGILACGCVDHEEDLMRSFGNQLGDHASNLAQLLHQV